MWQCNNQAPSPGPLSSAPRPDAFEHCSASLHIKTPRTEVPAYQAACQDDFYPTTPDVPSISLLHNVEQRVLQRWRWPPTAALRRRRGLPGASRRWRRLPATPGPGRISPATGKSLPLPDLFAHSLLCLTLANIFFVPSAVPPTPARPQPTAPPEPEPAVPPTTKLLSPTTELLPPAPAAVPAARPASPAAFARLRAVAVPVAPAWVAIPDAPARAIPAAWGARGRELPASAAVRTTAAVTRVR